jgi:hypothetical protein
MTSDKMIFLDISGDLTSGITLSFEVSNDPLQRHSCSLPKNEHLLDSLKMRSSYYVESDNYRALKNGKATSIDVVKIKANEELLISTFNKWIESNETLELRGMINSCFSKFEEKELLPKIFIRCQDIYLHSCPWEELKIFQLRRLKAEVSLSPLEPIHPHVVIQHTERVKSKILVVIGCKSGKPINLDESLQALDKFAEREDLDIEQLIDKTTTEIADCIKEFNPNIFIYLGHSQNYEMDFHNVNDLENAFEKAVQNGLEIAIINSCSSIQIALQLLRFGLPAVVAMRWAIHDEVANRFHNKFLDELITQKKTIPLAYREAKRDLQPQQSAYPSASLIPALFQIRPDLRIARASEPFVKKLSQLQDENHKLCDEIKKRKKSTYLFLPIMLFGGLVLGLFLAPLFLNQSRSPASIIKSDPTQSSAKVLNDVFQNTEKSIVQVRQRADNPLHSTGFIFYKGIDSKTYYVVTTNLEIQGLNNVTIYSIDGTEYAAERVPIKSQANFDIAVFKFQTCNLTKSFEQLEFGDLTETLKGLKLYVVGLVPSNNNRETFSHFSLPIELANVESTTTLEGYSLFYTLTSRKTMNGSPIITEQGFLAGMHARGNSSDSSETSKDDRFRFAQGVSITELRKIRNELKLYDQEKPKSCL